MSPFDLIVVIAIGWLIVRVVRKFADRPVRAQSPLAGFPASQVCQLPSLDNLRQGEWFRVVRASNPALADAWAEEARRRGLDVEWADFGTPRLDGWRVKLPVSPPSTG